LLESRAGASFRVDDQPDETILGLLAESLELLEVRDTRRNFHIVAWNFTFTTSMQEQDNPADFRWRCIHSDNPAANRFAGPDCRALSGVRAAKWTEEEAAFARTGRQAPRFVAEPQDARITEGESARFTAKAEGVPNPIYQWFSVDRANNGQVLAGETNPELVVSNPALGLSRYIVNVTNSAGDAQSQVVTLSVEPKLRLAQTRLNTASPERAQVGATHVKSGEDIERQRKRLKAEQAQELFKNRLRRNRTFFAILAITIIGAAGIVGWKKWASNKGDGTNKPPSQDAANPAAPRTTDIQSTSRSTPAQLPQGKSNPVEAEAKNDQGDKSLSADDTRLPDGWKNIGVGSISNMEVECIRDSKSPPRFDLAAAATGYSTNGDNFLFVYRTNTENIFRATLLKIYNDTPSRNCGIMLRESDGPNSPFVFVGASPQNIVMYCRNDKGELSSANGAAISLDKPVFLELRHGEPEQFVPAYSFDDKNWTPFQTCVISTNSPILVGFAVCSGDISNRVKVRLLDVSQKNKSAKAK
jgi:hypothetical protein